MKRGRPSAGDLLVPPPVEPGEMLPAGLEIAPRLAPPLHLSDAERAVWLQVVNDQPADNFSPVHAPMLEAYCGHVVRMRVLTEESQHFERAWLNEPGGLLKYDKLLGMIERETRAASSLATRMRITRQATDESRVAGRKNARARESSVRAKPWQQ